MQVPPPVSQNIPTHLDGNNVTIQSVPQSSAGTSVAVSTAVVSGSAPQNPATQQYNTASLCMFGQETVQDIVTKLQEMFQILKFIPVSEIYAFSYFLVFYSVCSSSVFGIKMNNKSMELFFINFISMVFDS